MIFRLYRKEDYDAVCDLVSDTFPTFPDRDDLGGLGVVVFNEGRIEGFAWALTSEGSRVAYIDYFFVLKEVRNKKIHGPMLMNKIFEELIKIGIKHVIGVLPEDDGYSDSLVRIYNAVGLKIVPAKYMVYADTEKVLNGIKERYGFKDRTKISNDNPASIATGSGNDGLDN